MTLGRWLDEPDNNISLLRFVAATMVVFSHSFPIALGPGTAEPPSPVIPTSFGTIGVCIFFTISGFLVTRSYAERRHLLRFLWARVLRIYPALVVAVVFCAGVVGPIFTALPLHEYAADSATRSFIIRDATLSSLTIQSTLPQVFSTNMLRYAVNDPLWTLPYELSMYGCVALAGLAGGLHRRTFPVVGGVVVLWMLAASFTRTFESSEAASFVRLGICFLAGACSYVYRDRVRIDARILVCLIVLAVVLYRTPVFMSAFRAVLIYAVFAFSFLPRGRIRQFNRFGDYSYGIYIYGFPCQQAVAALWPGIGPWRLFAGAMALTLPLAALSWHYIERPALSLKTRGRRPSSKVPTASSGARLEVGSCEVRG